MMKIKQRAVPEFPWGQLEVRRVVEAPVAWWDPEDWGSGHLIKSASSQP